VIDSTHAGHSDVRLRQMPILQLAI
jgi:hypothetical protein